MGAMGRGRQHGRVSIEDFEAWLKDEALFIQANQDSANKKFRFAGKERQQNGILPRFKFLHQLVTDDEPVEFEQSFSFPSLSILLEKHQTLLEKAKQLHPRYKSVSIDWLR